MKRSAGWIAAVYFVVCFTAAWWLGMWWSLPFLYLFLQGYTYVYLLSLSSGALGRWLDGLRSLPEPVEADGGTAER